MYLSQINIHNFLDTTLSNLFSEDSIYDLADTLNDPGLDPDEMTFRDLLAEIRETENDPAVYEELLFQLCSIRLPAEIKQATVQDMMETSGAPEEDYDEVCRLLEYTTFPTDKFGLLYSLERMGCFTAEDITVKRLLDLCQGMLLGFSLRGLHEDSETLSELSDTAETLLRVVLLDIAVNVQKGGEI